jgi:hypothetical protein
MKGAATFGRRGIEDGEGPSPLRGTGMGRRRWVAGGMRTARGPRRSGEQEWSGDVWSPVD